MPLQCAVLWLHLLSFLRRGGESALNGAAHPCHDSVVQSPLKKTASASNLVRSGYVTLIVDTLTRRVMDGSISQGLQVRPYSCILSLFSPSIRLVLQHRLTRTT
ncbi:hypothetical protein EDD85DRAFT_815493 [Armillaria nabsnona]|nr:hypothetical protein EDD85DRAFT_815493 [Armillaria nabsnona]